MRSVPGVWVPSCRAARKPRPRPSPSPSSLAGSGAACGASPARRRDESALPPPPPLLLLFQLPPPPPRLPGLSRLRSRRRQVRFLARLLPASAAAVAVPGSPPRCRDGDALLPGEGSEAERATPAHPVQAAEGGGQQVLRRLRGQRYRGRRRLWSGPPAASDLPVAAAPAARADASAAPSGSGPDGREGAGLESPLTSARGGGGVRPAGAVIVPACSPIRSRPELVAASGFSDPPRGWGGPGSREPGAPPGGAWG